VVAGLKESTRRTYDSAQKRYLDFCEKYGKSSMPASEETILLYVTYLYNQGLNHNSINVYLYAVRSLHVIEGLGNPLSGCLRLNMAMRAIQHKTNCRIDKIPITLDILYNIKGVIGDSYDESLLWSAMTLGHFGLLRAGEFTINSQLEFSKTKHLCVSDVSFHSLSQSGSECVPYMCVHIKSCKTDKKGQGFNLYIGCSKHVVCGYCAMSKFLGMRQQLGDSHLSSQPLFKFSSGAVLTRNMLIRQTKLYLTLSGVDSTGYTGHSFRVGGATSAASAGMSDWEIKLLGRWSSDTYQRYIKAPVPLLVRFAQRCTQQSSLSSLFTFRNPYISNIMSI